MTMITTRIENSTNVRDNSQSPARRETAASHLVQSSQFARWLAKILLFGLLVSILGMMLLPWQQTSRGNGRVIAYAPQERQQVVEAPVKGQIVWIKPGLAEGSPVVKGENLIEIQPFAENQVRQIQDQIREFQFQLATTETQVKTYDTVITTLEENLEFAVSALTDLVDAAKNKLEAKQLEIQAYEAKELQTRQQLDRQTNLYEKQIKPKREIEKLELEWKSATAKLEATRKEINGLEKELSSKKTSLKAKRLELQSKIDSKKTAKLDSVGKIPQIKSKIVELNIKLGELEQRFVKASATGIIFRMPINEKSQAIKVGDPIVTIMPETTRKAVELLVPGNDMPLVRNGQEVRLQFEGWPGVQFAGWPSVAVGTFSGVVSVVDATDNGKGQFRVLVTPTEREGEEWPSDQYLRQGVRANGWVMLKEVKLGWEIWRQLNGFPVIISDKEPGKKDAKPPKLPK